MTADPSDTTLLLASDPLPLAARFAANLRRLMAARGFSAAALGLEIWPDIERRQASDRIKQTLDGHWPRPARATELAEALGVDPGAFYVDTPA